jgi:hypothetical protein
LPVDADGVRFHPPGLSFTALTLVMRFVEGGWKVAGVGPRLPIPGWPPSWIELPAETVQ